MEEYFVVLGRTVKQYRKKQRYTQEVAAEIADISLRYYQEIEQGNKHPSLRILMRIALALDISLMQLLAPMWEEYSKKERN